MRPAFAELLRFGIIASAPEATDATPCNATLAWAVIDDRTLRVSSGYGDGRGEIELRPDIELDLPLTQIPVTIWRKYQVEH